MDGSLETIDGWMVLDGWMVGWTVKLAFGNQILQVTALDFFIEICCYPFGSYPCENSGCSSQIQDRGVPKLAFRRQRLKTSQNTADTNEIGVIPLLA